MIVANNKPPKRTKPPQRQSRKPGVESKMRPRPESKMHEYRASGRLRGQAALITGGDSGIGRAVAIACAMEGAVVACTRSLALSLFERGIRVNAVAPGTVWTPLIPSTFTPEEVARFGGKVPLGRPAAPDEIARCLALLVCDDAAFFVGQLLHPNGGEIINA